MSGVFDRGDRIDFFESPSVWSSLVFLLWFSLGAGSSSLRSTSPLTCLRLGVSSSSEAELVAPALPLITFFASAGALGVVLL